MCASSHSLGILGFLNRATISFFVVDREGIYQPNQIATRECNEQIEGGEEVKNAPVFEQNKS